MSHPFKLYLIGSLRNPMIPIVANIIRARGIEVFDDWYSAGSTADDCWRDYERARGHTYLEALKGHAARNVFEFDRRHLEASDGALLLLPAGQGKWTSILLEKEAASAPEFRYDVMYQFVDLVTDNLEEVILNLERRSWKPPKSS